MIRTKWLCYFCIILYHLPYHNCIVVITSDKNERPQLDAHFVVPGLNLSSLTTFTMCGRFKIYQFRVQSNVTNGTYHIKYKSEMIQGIFPYFSTKSLIDYNHNKDAQTYAKMGKDWKLKHVIDFFTIYGQDKYVPSRFKPNTWNTFCLKSNKTTSIYKFDENEIIFERKSSDDDDKGKKERPAFSNLHTYFFMNTFHPRNPYKLIGPMYGAFTDINVWNTILSSKEEEEWMNCRMQLGGNIIDWKNSSQHVKVYGLQQYNDSTDNICQTQKANSRFVGKERLDFFETLSFCEKFGEMTEISSNKTAFEVKELLKQYNSFWVFTGYTDIKEENEWVFLFTGKKLVWDNWNPGEPNSARGYEEDCASLRLTDNMKLFDFPCTAKLFPVCDIAEVLYTYIPYLSSDEKIYIFAEISIKGCLSR